MAIYIGVTTVVVAGTSGPLLGDGTNTSVAMQNSPGSNFTQFINQAVRQGFDVGRILLFARKANSGDVYIGGVGVTSTTGVALSPREMLPIGTGQVNDMNVGDLDVNADTTGDKVFFILEVK